MSGIILLPMVLALFFGVSISMKKSTSDLMLGLYAQVASVMIAVGGFMSYYYGYGEQITILHAGYDLTITFHVDGLTVFFGCLVSVLWPIAVYYARTYMSHEGDVGRFYTFYLLTFGVIMGFASSENMFTLYLFYELLTFITLPLVAHSQDSRAMYAGKVYIAYMMFGASLSFAGMMIVLSNEGGFSFVLGGTVSGLLDLDMLLAYVLMFVGFGIKAGIFPFNRWLLVAGVAPTPVTALLHAVAVVKAGAFATMRLTYYLYDYNSLKDTLAQWLVMGFVICGVVYGSYSGVKAQHLKRRLAYSTISQLSYILLGVASMSMLGLKAALLHMMYHAFCKIVLFFSVGNLLFSNHVEYLHEIKGWGKPLKGTFFPMAVCGIALIGVPPFGAFFSKYGLVKSLFPLEELGFVGIVALVTSAFFTVIYVFQIILTAYFPEKDCKVPSQIKPVPKPMERVLWMLTFAMIVLSAMGGYCEEYIDILLRVGEL